MRSFVRQLGADLQKFTMSCSRKIQASSICTSTTFSILSARHDILIAKDPSIIDMHFDHFQYTLSEAQYLDNEKALKFSAFLLAKGVDPNDPRESFPPVAFAALFSSPEVVDLLVRHGARLENSGALQIAARVGKLDMVRHLLELGVDVNENREVVGEGPALHAAVVDGHKDVVIFLLGHGANPDLRDYEGRDNRKTAHMRAQAVGNQELVDILATYSSGMPHAAL